MGNCYYINFSTQNSCRVVCIIRGFLFSDVLLIGEAVWLSREPFSIWAYKITCFRRAGPWSSSATIFLNLLSFFFSSFFLWLIFVRHATKLQMLSILVIAAVWIFCFVRVLSAPCELGCLLFSLGSQYARALVSLYGAPYFNETNFSTGCSAVVLFIFFDQWSLLLRLFWDNSLLMLKENVFPWTKLWEA